MAPNLATWFLQLGNVGAARNAAAAVAERRAAEARTAALARRFAEQSLGDGPRRLTPKPPAA